MMKKLSNYLLLLSMVGMLVFVYSCKDEDDDPIPAPTVTAPSGIINVENEGSGTATFNVTVASGVTATWSATGVNVSVSETSGTVSGGTVDVAFTAGATSGAGAVSLTVTDSEGQSAQATATINILAPGDNPITFNTNGNIPATATITDADTLEVTGVDIASDDGIKQVTVTVDGVAFPALDSIYDGSPTSAEYEFSLPAAGLGGSTYLVVFTAEDDNGSTTSFSHALTVEKAPAPEIIVSENIDADVTWYTDTVYVLAGRITVLDGVTLTIQPGTVIKGQSGAEQSAKALLVARGAKLMAEGTADAPIVFTTVADDLRPADIKNGVFYGTTLGSDINGQWGGVLVLGNAPISAQNDSGDDISEAQIEGIPTSDPNGLYGGNDKEDNSGVLKYISIRHGGTNIGSGNEINGLTLGGVGSGTVIKNIEIVANQDDGIEWFGGTVSVDSVVIWNCFDDGLDTDQAWNGTVSNFIVVTPQGGSGFELDGPEGTYKDGNHTITNGTVYAGDQIDLLVDFDENTNVDASDIYFYGISTATTVTDYKLMSDAGNGSATGWEYSDVSDAAAVFVDIPGSELTEVNTNANTIGIKSDEGFEWTWASQSGALGSIGL
jgi:hypothetical protein